MDLCCQSLLDFSLQECSPRRTIAYKPFPATMWDVLPATSDSFWAIAETECFRISLDGKVLQKVEVNEATDVGWNATGGLVFKNQRPMAALTSPSGYVLYRDRALQFGGTTVLIGERFLSLTSARGHSYISDAFSDIGFTTSLSGSTWIIARSAYDEPLRLRYGSIGGGTRSRYPHLQGKRLEAPFAEASVALSPGGRYAFLLVQGEKQCHLPMFDRWRRNFEDKSFDLLLVRVDLRDGDTVPLATLRGFYGMADLRIRMRDFTCVGRHLVVNVVNGFRIFRNVVPKVDVL